ncbi:hypothetical protein ACI2UK_13960 [Ralstonia nicotianae]|uniref:hypothetical protein n=1 Tax=Ralstonia pseudosolanacearum TaxID=1310165 RepID=UPI00200526A9|nr:hypothetical protein [Ralstonia pseudosolanacearum]MCK4118351.1 hypothetical protein [Ralstonia pseudosolanacearum]
MQEGEVIAVNRRRGFFIIAIDQGDYVVFELLSGIDISIGDRIRGDLNALGSEDLYHVGHEEEFEAYGQSGPSSLSACRRLLG